MNIGAVLLAAGSGTRFDPAGHADKLMVPWQADRPVLWHSASNLLTVVGPVVAVVRPTQHARRQCLEALGISVVVSETANRGMGAALAAGVAALSGVEGCLVCLGDMPALRPETIAQVRDAIDGPDVIAAPRHEGEPGHPVGFGAQWFAELCALDADVGPRHLLARERVRWLDVGDPGCRLDIDRPADIVASLTRVSPQPV